MEADCISSTTSRPRSAACIKPAGFENAQGIISAAYLKDASDPQWDNDPGMKQFYDFLAKDSRRATSSTAVRWSATASRRPWFRC